MENPQTSFEEDAVVVESPPDLEQPPPPPPQQEPTPQPADSTSEQVPLGPATVVDAVDAATEAEEPSAEEATAPPIEGTIAEFASELQPPELVPPTKLDN